MAQYLATWGCMCACFAGATDGAFVVVFPCILWGSVVCAAVMCSWKFLKFQHRNSFVVFVARVLGMAMHKVLGYRLQVVYW